MVDITLEKIQEIKNILDGETVVHHQKPILKEFVMLEFLLTRDISLGLSISKSVNFWMAKGYTPLGGQFHVDGTLYFPMVLKTRNKKKN
jgi:hypothetical protein